MVNPLSKLDKLRALTGDPNTAQIPIANPKPEPAFDNTISSGWEDWSSVKASNVYDGTDSDDDERIMNRKNLLHSGRVSVPPSTCPSPSPSETALD